MKRTLVQYQGGGYSGCFWEWNFFYFDRDGKFHNIFSSGREGVQNETEALKVLDKSSTYKYLDYREADKQDFATKTHSALVKMVIQWFEDMNIDCPFYAICEDCGEKIYEAENIILDESGTELRCYECYALGSCGYCRAFYGVQQENDEWNGLITTKEKICELWDLPDKVVEKLFSSYSPICIYCAEKLAKQELDIMQKQWDEKWLIGRKTACENEL